VFLGAPLAAAAQSPQPSTPRVTLPPVVVTAQKEPTDIRDLPGSVTAVAIDSLTESSVRIVSDAALFSPNTFFTEFTARKASNPRFRGIGASPANPAITTYIDGVPQLNANSSSIELMDVDQIEFVRGPQSPLFGRNALGGIINVSSRRPSLAKWSGSVVAPFANQSSREVRGSVTGPLGRHQHRGRHPGARRLHRERGDGKRRGFAVGHVRQGPAAVGAVAELGGAGDLQRRARPRRRLRADGSRRRS
jgi:iron complex outermembrane receptor protein